MDDPASFTDGTEYSAWVLREYSMQCHLKMFPHPNLARAASNVIGSEGISINFPNSVGTLDESPR